MIAIIICTIVFVSLFFLLGSSNESKSSSSSKTFSNSFSVPQRKSESPVNMSSTAKSPIKPAASHEVLSSKALFIRAKKIPPTWDGKVPGIGPAYTDKLKKAGFETPFQLVGKYFSLNCDKGAFEDFLKNEVGMASNFASDAAEAIHQVCSDIITS